MKLAQLIDRQRSWVLAAAALVPLLVCAALSVLRDSISPTTATLLLVVLVVAGAATGLRAAGLLAAASSAVWFDWFLTEPYGHFSITDPRDVEAAVLLLVVGAAVSELSLWGRRQQASASRGRGYLDGVLRTAGLAAASISDGAEVVEVAARQITEVLGADHCRYQPSPAAPADAPVIDPDGSLRRRGRTVDTRRDGLPVDQETLIPVRARGEVRGHFAVTAASRVARPTLEQCQVAVLLADQAGAAVAGQPAE